MAKLGIRKEDKNKWEKRTPIVPEHVKKLIKNNIEVLVEQSDNRGYSDEEYQNAGAVILPSIVDSPVIFGVKEIPESYFKKGNTYLFFSHTIKGQKDNMPRLKKMMELECTLIDYEKITDDNGRRLVFFGNFAGLAGMIDTFWGLGQKFPKNNPLNKVKQALEYFDVKDAKKAIKQVGEEISINGLPKSLTPLVVGFGGYGNVSKGAQAIFDLLPHIEVTPEQLPEIIESYKNDNKHLIKVVFKEKHIVEPINKENDFELFDYFKHPEKYRSIFDQYLPYIDVYMNCIYWDTMYPRFITKQSLESLERSNNLRLKFVGDITCDTNGSVEINVKSTNSGNPFYTYFPKKNKFVDKITTDGITILAVDNLPCELARDSSMAFSQMLFPFVEAVAKADFNVSFDKLELPEEIKRAIILLKGKLTEQFSYLKKYLA